jgi:TetR/AcrR family transcriptional regulator
VRLRDAERSREAILDAAERLFAERGFERASLHEIGAAAGLSRATPSYFFGSKDRLYEAVLERVLADRHHATEAAFAPVHAWCGDERADGRALERALADATDGYLAFLVDRPAFARLITREDLAGGERLRAAPREGAAMADAFAALRTAQPKGGLTPFRVRDAILVYVSLAFAPVAHHATFAPAVGLDLGDPRQRRRHARLVVRQTLALLRDEG